MTQATPETSDFNLPEIRARLLSQQNKVASQRAMIDFYQKDMIRILKDQHRETQAMEKLLQETEILCSLLLRRVDELESAGA